MIQLIIAATIIFVFVRQFMEPRASRWKARAENLAPLGRYLREDYRAVRHYRRRPHLQPVRVVVPDDLSEL